MQQKMKIIFLVLISIVIGMAVVNILLIEYAFIGNFLGLSGILLTLYFGLFQKSFGHTEQTSYHIRNVDDAGGKNETLVISVNSRLKEIFEWFERQAKIIRTHQTLKLTLNMDTMCDDAMREIHVIRVKGLHKFRLNNVSNVPISHKISISTDLGKKINDANEGFLSVTIHNQDDTTLLEGEILAQCLSTNADETREIFTFTQLIQPGEYISFEICTVGIYGLSDRLLWIVQDFCNRFDVDILNETGSNSSIRYSVNHHQKEEIESSIALKRRKNSDKIVFGYPIYPCEGFTMSWDFSKVNISSDVGLKADVEV